jgi:hypothetical protein
MNVQNLDQFIKFLPNVTRSTWSARGEVNDADIRGFFDAIDRIDRGPSQ